MSIVNKRYFQWGVIALLIGVCLFSIVNGLFQQQEKVMLDEPIPPFTVQNMIGDTVDLSAYNNEPLLINLWATWCTPCINELPLLNEAQAFVSDVKVIAINMGDTTAAIQSFVDRYDLTMTILRDEKLQLKPIFNVRSYPMTIMVGRDGTVKQIVVGEITDFSQLLEMMRNTLLS